MLYDCSKCPAYCCSYGIIEITKRDLRRIARHFGVSCEQAERRYTKTSRSWRSLRHKKDHIFEKVCAFLDTETRRCTIYDARPSVCRRYPDSRRCGYYDFLAFERRRQDDLEYIPSA
ncbi:MAG TPA: YkgJ family cysteine cluster protein [Blastocatellia bacterium]